MPLVTRTTLIVGPLLIEPSNVTNCPKQAHQPQHIRGLKFRINHGKCIGNIMGVDIPKICGIHQSATIGSDNLRSGEMLNEQV